MIGNEVIFFGSFLIFIILILVIDLGLFNKKSHIISSKEALGWTVLWVTFAIGFYFLLRTHGHLLHDIQNLEQLQIVEDRFEHSTDLSAPTFEENLSNYRKSIALEYITGYLIEYSLSVDNIFVIILIFMAFGVRKRYFHRVLFWGILGAIVLRFIFIFLSAALIQQFYWILYIFGGFLVFTGVKMFITRNKKEEIDTKNHPVVKFSSRFFRVFPRYVKDHFFVKKDHKVWVTPLFLVLLVIEFSDLIFAVDSVPAIFSITKDPYIVFFSNIFAIIGLRSLFFLLINVMTLFSYLKEGLSVLLSFIGFKMLFHHWLKEIGFTTAHSLYIILGILSVSIAVSLLFPKKEEHITRIQD